MNTVDDDLRTDPFYCFVAEEITNGRADLFIEWSFVTHVKLLNVVSEGHSKSFSFEPPRSKVSKNGEL